MVTEGESSAGGQPHDALFRLVFGDPDNAGSELRSVLPPDLIAHIDLDGLVLQEGTFIDDALRHSQTDVLFATTVHGRDAYLYVLIEHQSTPDRLMALRMLGYQLRIWERHLAQPEQRSRTRPLPLIIPVVIYQGRRQWIAPTDLADLIDVDQDLVGAASDLVPRFTYLLDDLTVVDDEALRARPLTATARITFVSFVHAPDDSDVTRWLSDWADDLAAIDYERLVAIFNYLVRVSVTPVENVVRFAGTVGAEAREAAMTTADQLIAQGRAEGEARGEARGQARLLMRMLTSKFGELDPDVRARVAHATAEEIGVWSDRLVQGAVSIEEIVGPQ